MTTETKDDAYDKLADAFISNRGSSSVGKMAAAASVEPLDLESRLKLFDSVPLFMKDFPTEGQDEEGGGGGGDDNNTAIEALQSLVHDDLPDNVAANFKSQGNQYFIGKRYREALGFYTQAIEAHPTDLELLETLHTNRAACHLELQNYGSCLRDTSSALGINPKNEKAFYRAAKALLALDKTKEALDCCQHGLLIDPTNHAIQLVKTKIEQRAEVAAKREIEKLERERRKKLLDISLHQAFLSRGLWLETSSRPPQNPHPAHFDPDSIAPNSLDSIPLNNNTTWQPPDAIRTPLIMPVFFMYPQYAQSDLISHYHEDTPISDHLDAMFPLQARGSLPWDISAQYYSSNLQVYATTKKLRLLKIGRKLTLREIMDQGFQSPNGSKDPAERDGMLLQDGILSLVVLPKSSDAEKEWIEKFKKQRQATQNKKT